MLYSFYFLNFSYFRVSIFPFARPQSILLIGFRQSMICLHVIKDAAHLFIEATHGFMVDVGRD